MSEVQSETKNTTPEVQASSPNKLQNLLSDWRVRVGLMGTAIAGLALGLFFLVFFWQHSVAEMGMKSWSSHANATPIECMIKDTNSDGYVSCSAMLHDEVVPLECGASIFNMGCRVNYGAAAAPQVRSGNRNNLQRGL
ncbi:hypothetical protein [Phormidium sp. CCY1219]|uniref:hypothetical protein n=1 Tax=Phormidium sp. CCY1219 TaxID=2886104 RepID=UPI002D1F6DA1|nr:hypothetical protein [Phormidium sp. CCY1219]MEB3827493.1 hypothetical protein [Phormidium sp. CCY1219]